MPNRYRWSNPANVYPLLRKRSEQRDGSKVGTNVIKLFSYSDLFSICDTRVGMKRDSSYIKK